MKDNHNSFSSYNVCEYILFRFCASGDCYNYQFRSTTQAASPIWQPSCIIDRGFAGMKN